MLTNQLCRGRLVANKAAQRERKTLNGRGLKVVERKQQNVLLHVFSARSTSDLAGFGVLAI